MDLFLSPTSYHSFTTFGDLLKYLRRRQHLTQLELSITVGYSEAQISRLEKNQRLPDLTAIKALFIPALHLEDDPQLTARFLELAQSARHEDAPTPGIPPYKGLLYYDESDSELFFGREALTAQLVGHVMELATNASTRFLAVVGASGSGKSSLVRAGLAVALQRAGWEPCVFTPTATPLRILETNLNLLRTKKAERVLILVDQFEEVFTLCHDELERIGFFEKLLACGREKTKKHSVVIALRADFYSHCAQYPQLRQAVAAEQEYIGQMTIQELRRAIEEPARRGGWEFEPGLVEVMLQDLSTHGSHEPEPGVLPLLSHALLATWERRRGRMIMLDGYRASGGVQGAIAETAESVFTDQLDHTQQEIAHDVFLRLTELGEGTEDTRRRTGLNELVRQSTGAAELRGVLNILAEARLITLNEDSAEVAHEALIREWQRLHEWLTQDREGLLLHRHLSESGNDWEARGHDPAELYRGARLAQAREWAAVNEERINTMERAFLAASIEQEEQYVTEREEQRQRELKVAQTLADTQKERAEEQKLAASRLRRRALYLTLALFLTILMAGAALYLGDQARKNAATALATFERAERERIYSFSHELANQATNNLTVDPELSALLALRAVEVTDEAGQEVLPEAANSLHRAVQAMRVRFTISGHEKQVWGMDISPDGSRLATASDDGTAKIWDVSTGRELLVLDGQGGIADDLAFSPDGTQLAVTYEKGQTIVWDSETGQKLHTLKGSSWATSVGFSPDGTRLAVGYYDNIAQVWDLHKSDVSLTLTGHESAVDGVDFSPDGKRLVTAADDRMAKVWDAATGKELLTLRGHAMALWSARFSPDGAKIATAGWDGTAKIWDSVSGDLLFTLGGHTNEVTDVAFSPDGKNLASASLDGSIIIWSVFYGLQIEKLSGSNEWMPSVVFSPDGKTLVSSGGDGKVRLWDWNSPEEELFTLIGHTGRVVGVAISPDGTRLATTSTDETARVWDATTGRELVTIPEGGNKESAIWTTDVGISADGRRLTTISADGNGKVWDMATGRELFSLLGHSGRIGDVTFSPDGKRLATVGEDNTVRLWDAFTGKELFTLRGHTKAVFDAAFSPDGSLLASAADETVRLWDVNTGKELRVLSGLADAFRVVFNPNSTRLVSLDHGFDNIVRIWDTTSGEELQRLKGHQDMIWDAAFSPDGRLVATGGKDTTAKIWDVETGEKLFDLIGHSSSVWRVLFSPDGSLLATAGGDATVKVWHTATGQELLTLPGHTNLVTAIAFSSDGKHLFTASDDGTVQAYTLSIDELMSIARSRLTRTWTSEECQKYLHQEECPPPPN